MKTIKPNALKKGDTIGIIAPASPPKEDSLIHNSVSYFEKQGFSVKLGEHLFAKNGYLAGTDEQRTSDLHNMFMDKEVKAVFCLRGGYGAGRLLDLIDFSLIKKNPKIFVGYSDITFLQMAFLKKTGLVTFSGPMPAVDFSEEKVDDYTEEHFWKMLTVKKKPGKLENPNVEKFFTLNKGKGEGKLVGGNLTIVSAMLSSDYFPRTSDYILLLEEINEQPYKIDRMLLQIKHSGLFKNASGIILGRFVNCVNDDPQKQTLNLNQVIEDYFDGIDKPVIYNVKHGHVKQNLTLPFGVKYKINASRGFVEIMESPVS